MDIDLSKIKTLLIGLLVILVICIVQRYIRSQKEEKLPKLEQTRKNRNSKLDNITIVTNILLSVFYAPLSLMGLFGAMMSDNPPNNIIARAIMYVGIILCVATPAFCGWGIISSVTLRKKGKSLSAFFVQFAPILIFAISVLIIFASDLIANLF